MKFSVVLCSYIAPYLQKTNKRRVCDDIEGKTRDIMTSELGMRLGRGMGFL